MNLLLYCMLAIHICRFIVGLLFSGLNLSLCTLRSFLSLFCRGRSGRISLLSFTTAIILMCKGHLEDKCKGVFETFCLWIIALTICFLNRIGYTVWITKPFLPARIEPDVRTVGTQVNQFISQSVRQNIQKHETRRLWQLLWTVETSTVRSILLSERSMASDVITDGAWNSN